MKEDYYAINTSGRSISVIVKSIYRCYIEKEDIYKFNITDDAYYSYIVVTDGAMVVHYSNGVNLTIKKGQVVLLWSKDTLSYEIVGDKCKFYWIYFTIFGCSLSLLSIYDMTITEEDIKAFDLMIELLKNENIYDSTKVNTLFVNYLLVGIEQLNKIDDSASSLHRVEIISSANYIKDNISKKFSVKELAEMQKMAVSQFRKYFHKITGMYPAKFIAEQRLILAKDYLLNTNYTLEQIADLVGFENSYYLSSCFKKRYGLSPKKFTNKQ